MKLQLPIAASTRFSRAVRRLGIGTYAPCALLLLACTLLPRPAGAQASWQALSSAPTTGRYNDVYFVDPERGWTVNGDGAVYATHDGGRHWKRQLFVPGGHFRSVGFLDAERGFVGAVGLGEFGTTDPNVLYRTTDGGDSWSAVTDIGGAAPAGLCGMHVVNDSVIVAVGRVRGPAAFARSTDGGQTWTARDMGDHAAGLIDVYFAHPDSGFAVGLTNDDHEQSSCVVLQTADGGETWAERFRSSRTGEWCWKMSWPSRRVGYASLQRNTQSPIYFLKTTDGGATWKEKLFSEDYYFVQGIGFVTETRGWIGGNSSSPVYETTDGGETWTPEALRPRLNRFRFLGDSLGYAVGRQVHKFGDWTATAVEEVDLPEAFALDATPNPFSDAVQLEADLPAAGQVTLTVYDLLGRRVATRAYGTQPPGVLRLHWDGNADDGSRVAPGRYVARLRAGAYVTSTVVIRVR